MDYSDYPDLDPAEPRIVEILSADGSVHNTIWASLDFCVAVLGVVDLPQEVYPVGGSWRVQGYLPPATSI